MRLSIAKRIRADHGDLAAILRAAFATVDHRHVYVKLKGTDPDVSWLVECIDPTGCGRPINHASRIASGHDCDATGHVSTTKRRAEANAGDMTRHHPAVKRLSHKRGIGGRAYDGVPGLANVPASTRYLVTIAMPTDPEAIAHLFPRSRVYGEGRPSERKRSPRITVESWRDELFAVAAHEAKHIEQFKEGKRRSENAAERHALRALNRWKDPQ